MEVISLILMYLVYGAQLWGLCAAVSDVTEGPKDATLIISEHEPRFWGMKLIFSGVNPSIEYAL